MTSTATHNAPNGTAHAPPAVDIERNEKHPSSDDYEKPRSRFSVVVEDFSFAWFTVSMNTGILSVLFHQSPYQFDGLKILSTILFVFNLFLFTIFFLVLLLRMLWYPKTVVHTAKTNLMELSLMGAVPIAWYTLCAQVAMTVTHADWGGESFAVVAIVMWWIGTAVMAAISVVVLIVVTKTNVTDTSSINPSIIIPFVGTTTDAVAGALIVNEAVGMTPSLAIPTIIVSYMMNGIGFFVAILIFAVYFSKLINHGPPPAAQTPGLSLLVGPPGQTSAALLLLGTSARKYFGDPSLGGTFFTSASGEAVAAASVMLALLILGLGVVFMAFVIYMILDVAVKRQHKWSLLWWSTIFPFATVNTAWISLAKEMDSATFRVLATIFTLALTVNYLVQWGFTVLHVWKGDLLSGRRKGEGGGGRPKAQ